MSAAGGKTRPESGRTERATKIYYEKGARKNMRRKRTSGGGFIPTIHSSGVEGGKDGTSGGP